jgi:hypothetical protein
MPSVAASVDLVELAASIDAQHELIDERLSYPARWRGVLRREQLGRSCPVERARVAATFDRLAAGDAFERPLDVAFLLRVYEHAIGGRGLRRCRVRIGSGAGTTPFPPPEQVPERLEAALIAAVSSTQPAPLTAACLHLDLLLVHPFVDGNGRVARLLAATVLLRAGYRSTLLTAVEQHFAATPAAYLEAFYRLAASGCGDVGEWLRDALTAMMRRSFAAAAFRRRDGRLRRVLEELGVHGRTQDRVLSHFDLGRTLPADIVEALSRVAEPWCRVPRPGGDLTELLAQLRRLRQEETIEPARRRGIRSVRPSSPPPWWFLRDSAGANLEVVAPTPGFTRPASGMTTCAIATTSAPLVLVPRAGLPPGLDDCDGCGGQGAGERSAPTGDELARLAPSPASRDGAVEHGDAGTATAAKLQP